MKHISAALICTLGAIFLFLVQTERIIFNTSSTVYAKPKSTHTASCTLYWHEHLLQPEIKQIVQTQDLQENLVYVINTWLQFLYSEDMHKKVHADAVMLSPSGNELFISFDRKPFEKHMSIAEKLGFIRNLFRTIKPHTAARKIRLLVRHEILDDAHLDFSSGWDIE